MDETTQQNAALAEQTSAASLSMKEKGQQDGCDDGILQVGTLNVMVDGGGAGMDFFKTRGPSRLVCAHTRRS